MQKKTRKNVSPRVFEETQAWYAKTFESVNAGSEFILEAFPHLFKLTISRLKGKFSPGDLMLMIDVMNSAMLMPQHMGWTLPANVIDGIALDHLDKKWKIDGDKLNKKLAELHLFESSCLEIWIQGFWNQDDHSNIEEYVDALSTK